MNAMIPETLPDYERMRVVERPDGVYWRSKGTARERGPFATLLEAMHDMQPAEDGAPEPAETLQEVQAEIGIADWIDPETGAPAEEQRPHIEEH